MQLASSFWCKARRLPDDVVPRGEHGTTGEKEQTVTGTGTEAGTETRTST